MTNYITTPYLTHMYSTYPLLSILMIMSVFTLLWYANKHPNPYLNKVNKISNTFWTIRHDLRILKFIFLIGFVIVCIIYTMVS